MDDIKETTVKTVVQEPNVDDGKYNNIHRRYWRAPGYGWDNGGDAKTTSSGEFWTIYIASLRACDILKKFKRGLFRMELI